MVKSKLEIKQKTGLDPPPASAGPGSAGPGSGESGSGESTTEGTDPPLSQGATPESHCQQSLAKGYQLLQSLEKLAIAARVEAQRAELERLLSGVQDADARDADVRALDVWLARHASNPDPASLPDGQGLPSWGTLDGGAILAAIQARNASHQTDLSKASPKPGDVSAGSIARHGPAEEESAGSGNPAGSGSEAKERARESSSRSKAQQKSEAEFASEATQRHRGGRRRHAKSRPTGAPRDSASRATSDSAAHSPGARQRAGLPPSPCSEGQGPLSKVAAPASKIVGRTKAAQAAGKSRSTTDKRAELAVKVQPQPAGEGESKSGGRSRLVGVVASMVAHGFLLIALAVVTLKLPAETPSLALESAIVASEIEAVQVSEAVQVESPELDSSQPAEPLFDASDSLGEIQASLADTLAMDASSSASLVMSAASASQAIASAHFPVNAGASFFGASANGSYFCYVIDASGSMRGGPWEAAKVELLKSLASLKSNQRFYVVFYNRSLSPMPSLEASPVDVSLPAASAVYASPENLQKIQRWIATLEIGIGASPNKALKFAIEKEPDAIYLLTDGVTTVDVPKFLREVNRVEGLLGDSQTRVPIHTIAYYTLDGQAMLRQIAAENQGQFSYVPDPRR